MWIASGVSLPRKDVMCSQIVRQYKTNEKNKLKINPGLVNEI